MKREVLKREMLHHLWGISSSPDSSLMPDPSLMKDAARYMVGVKSQFLADCQEIVRHRTSSSEVVSKLYTELVAGPNTQAADDLCAFLFPKQEASELDQNRLEIDRLYGTVRGILCCTGLALALRDTNPAVSWKWCEKALSCWGLLIPDQFNRDQIAGQWSDDAIQSADALFGPLFDGMPRKENDKIAELWDLTRYLLSAEIRPAFPFPSVRMWILGVGEGVGFCPELTLEYLSEGEGLCRHPETLLLPCDARFLGSWKNAGGLVRTGFPWNNEFKQWDGGSIRWRVSMLSNSPMISAKGGSAGGAIGAGMILLLTKQPTDNVAVTACIDETGNLHDVDFGSIPPKFMAALKAGLHTFILKDTQATESRPALEALAEQRPVELIGCKTVLEVAEKISQRSGIRGKYLKKIHGKSGQIQLLNATQAIQDNYIEMPLLKEVKIEKLASRGFRDGPGKEDEASEQFPGPSFRRWEEFVREEAVEHQDVPLDKLFQKDRRLVVVGPPGSGKSALVQYLAWRTSDPLAPLPVCDRVVVPAQILLRQWAREQSQGSVDLAAFLGTSAFRGWDDMPTADTWRTWLKRGEVLLMLDGLDEVPSDFVRAVGDTIAEFESCPMLITCRTVSKHRLEVAAKGVPLYTPSSFNPEQQKQYIDHYPQHAKGYNPTLLAEELQRSEIQILATSPLLLSIFCFVADVLGTNVLPDTRTKLYDETVRVILNKLMDGNKLVEVPYPTPVSEPTRREALQELALEMLKGADRRILFTEKEVVGALRISHSKEVADALLKDFRENSRVLNGTPGSDYWFLHPTFQEFLAACALAEQAAQANVGFDGEERGETGVVADWGKKDWQEAFRKIDAEFKEAGYERKKAGRHLNDPRLSFLALLDHMAWLPEWQEVFLFLAGTLNDPVPLLDLLSDRFVERDDMFRHRLALAALSMAEIDPALRSQP